MISSDLQNFISQHYRVRKLRNYIACGMLLGTAALALGTLFGVFGYVLARGVPALNLDFFVNLPKPVGETGGGMANALVGTTVMVILGSLVGIPWGILTGVYLSEYGNGRLGTIVRFSTELLSSVPSIVIGLFIYAVLVVPMHGFSGIAGAAALAIIMIPTVARTSEELLRLVPNHIREAGLALGVPRWKVLLRIVLRGCASGITTGVMLAIARIAGETAPLLFTALNNHFWSAKLTRPMASLPVQIYTYAISPFEDWHRQAWAGALVLVVLVFTLNICTRLVMRTSAGSRE